ncbi:Helicostatins [Folsomia candida]|uniref:Helicostatins n=1 Tax=Folsomia candida TaxID=158441 RepID=A0A226E887_FOLCA|nr:Helicostatins [Folsomia candida]
MKMKRSGNMTTAAPQVILLVLASCACVWAAQMSDNYEKMRLLYNYPSGFKRLPSYDFGLGKRSFGESDLASASSSSYEEQLSPLDALLEQQQQQQQGGGQQLAYVYPNAFGKRTRAYGFGLGKRQERRSKIYSFGLGKRQSHDGMEDYDGNASPPTAERRASSQRQFAFGLGKRDLNAAKE